MTDIWSSQKRSEVMALIRGRDTIPEKRVRTALRNHGFRLVMYPNLPGRPGIVLKDARIAVFVHGCFWHGCSKHYRAPKSRRAYWSEKLAGNISRDRLAARKLRALGWRVMIVWECAVREDCDTAVLKIVEAAERTPSYALSK